MNPMKKRLTINFSGLNDTQLIIRIQRLLSTFCRCFVLAPDHICGKRSIPGSWLEAIRTDLHKENQHKTTTQNGKASCAN